CFLSSRRRHTTFSRDWSSDVCSSDLVRLQKWGARVMDIDILYFNDETIHSEHLQVPHPYLHLRRFTLLPLCEVAPQYIHPVIGKIGRASCRERVESGRRDAGVGRSTS